MSLTEYFTFVFPEILIIACVLFLAYVIQITKNWRRNFPPGPIGFPIVGCLPFLEKDAYIKFTELSKIYGEVFSIRLGSELIVVLNGSNSIREAFSKPEFLGRPKYSAFDLFGYKSPFFVSDIHVWYEQRKFVVNAMKDFGFGKTKMESQMQSEIHHFLEELKKTNGQPVDLKPTLLPSLLNNICLMIFGKRSECDDPEVKLFKKAYEEASRMIKQTAIHIFFPWIKHIPFVMKWLHYDSGMRSYLELENYFKQNIDRHKKTLDASNIRDFVDRYLVEMEVRGKKDSMTTFNESTLLGSLMDLVGASLETTRISIIWCLYTIAAYNEIQKAVKKEILEILGPQNSPQYEDRKRMPYTHAVILEVMRMRAPAPLLAFKCTTADTTVKSYDIPKGTTILTNLWAPHYDPKNWEEPNDFNPERFLGPDGKVVKSNNFLPFSYGRRACPGETMAYMELFLYFVSVLQKFDLSFPEGFIPTFEADGQALYWPTSHKIRFLPAN